MKTFALIVFIFALSLMIFETSCNEQTINIGQSLTDLIKQGTEQLNEENIKNKLIAGPNKLKSLFFNGNDSQYLDVNQIASKGVEKTKEGVQVGVSKIKDLFFNGENSQLADLGGIASTGFEKSKEGFNTGVEKVKELANDANSILVKDVGGLMENVNEKMPEVKEQAVGFGTKIVNWFKKIFGSN